MSAMPPPLPTANVRFPEWWGQPEYRVEYEGQWPQEDERPPRYSFDPDTMMVRIGPDEELELTNWQPLTGETLDFGPRTGSREDMYQHVQQAIWDTLNERAPYGVPMPDRDVVRDAASMVVENIRASFVLGGQAALLNP